MPSLRPTVSETLAAPDRDASAPRLLTGVADGHRLVYAGGAPRLVYAGGVPRLDLDAEAPPLDRDG